MWYNDAMADITFDDSKFKIRSRRFLGEPEVPTMIKFLVVKGIVKTEKQAVIVLLSTIIVLLGMTIYLLVVNFFLPTGIDYTDPKFLL